MKEDGAVVHDVVREAAQWGAVETLSGGASRLLFRFDVADRDSMSEPRGEVQAHR